MGTSRRCRETFNNGKNIMTDLVIKNPDGSYATTDATNLKGHNWHKTIRASDGTIHEEDIKRCL